MKKKEHKIEMKRRSNRWLMLFYDTLTYAVCWIVVLAAFRALNSLSMIYMAIGYVLFVGSRFVLEVYKSVLRYGSVSAFSRLICADVIAGTILLLGNLL